MRFGDIQGKGKVYSEAGDILLARGEKKVKSVLGTLKRGWVRYKLGWRTILFKGYGNFNFTNRRIVYLENPEYIENIHTFNLDHELGDFGGWDYHAHSMRRAARQGAFMFFELPYNEISKFKHAKDFSTIYTEDKVHKYKLIIEQEISHEIEEFWKKYKDL